MRMIPRQDDDTRINEMIRVPQVRVIDQHGEAIGILSIVDARERALNAALDLVEVAPKAQPPVCRIMDYGKFKYEKAKKEKEARKKQHVMHLKEIKFHPKTEIHDYTFKLEHARKFLLKGDRVKLTVVFRGREITYKDFGKQLLERMDQDLADVATVESQFKMEGKNMVSSYIPDKVKIQIYKRKLEKEKRESGIIQQESEQEEEKESIQADSAMSEVALPSSDVDEH